MSFCDRCGQHLGWKNLEHAEITNVPCPIRKENVLDIDPNTLAKYASL